MGNEQVGEVVEKRLSSERVYAVRYADRYGGPFHEATEEIGKAFTKLLNKKAIDYRVMIDLHDTNPQSKGWKDSIRVSSAYWVSNGIWAEHYIDGCNDIVFTGSPHFDLSIRKYDKEIYKAVRDFLLNRQGSLPRDMLPLSEGEDYREYASDYLNWYKNWERKGTIIPAAISISSTPREFDIGKNHIVVEFVQKVDYLTEDMKNGNVHRISVEDGYDFIRSMIDYFLENPYETQ